MKESHRKGVASHPGPESCAASRKVAIEALTGGSAGRVLSCEIIATGVPTPFSMAEGNTGGCVIASIRWTPRSLRPLACMETPRTGTLCNIHRFMIAGVELSRKIAPGADYLHSS